MKFAVGDIEAFVRKLEEVIASKATEDKGLHRVRGSIDLTFKDEEKRDEGSLTLVGCYAYTKGGFFGKKRYHFRVAFDVRRQGGEYVLELKEIQAYAVSKRGVELAQIQPPEEIFEFIAEDFAEAGAKKL